MITAKAAQAQMSIIVLVSDDPQISIAVLTSRRRAEFEFRMALQRDKSGHWEETLIYARRSKSRDSASSGFRSKRK